ncbi:TonB-dependent receptor plug domain-containing protein [Tsuneonella sp. HG222]
MKTTSLCKARLLGCSAATLAAAIGGTPVFAQTAAPVEQVRQDADEGEPQSATSAADAEEIVVTGSRIRGVSAVGSNVIAFDQTEIAEAPATTTADLLRKVPQIITLGANPAGGSAQNGAANATRSAGINLRGLGNSATLILYDGKRLPPQGTQGQLTDPSVIPAIALGRLEVVADGASAVYGSDAVGGVVNFILRKNFDGLELSARAGMTEGASYTEKQVSGLFGKTWGSGWGMIAAEYTDSSALYGYDLPWYQTDNRSRGGRDLRSNFCNPSTITVGGGTYAIPAGGVTPANVGTLVRGTRNSCFYNGPQDNAVLPESERRSVIGAVSQDLGDRIRIFADGFYGNRKGRFPFLPSATLTVPSTNPFFVTPVAGATSVSVTWSIAPDVGPVFNPYYTESWNVAGGVEAQLFGDVQATFYVSHGASEDLADRRNNGINGIFAAQALADPNPATALNVFGGPNNPATLRRILDSYFVILGKTELDVYNLQFDGSLLELPGGALRFALGGEYRKEYTFTDLITGSSLAQTHVIDDGSRNVKALFGELFLPIFGSGNAQPGLHELSLSLAGRYEEYSDFGDTANPKIGLTYAPFEGMRLRASYGTSFRAPTFTDKAVIGGGAGLYFDTLPGPAGNLTGIGIAGGNPDIRPEEATTWSVGAELEPAAIPGLFASATYFNIAYRNQIQALRGTANLLTSPLYASFVNLAPTAAQIAALRTSGLPINNPNVLTGNIQFIADGRRQNLGESKIDGIDAQVGYRFDVGTAEVDLGANASYFLSYDFKAVPSAAFADVLGTFGFPQKFRLQADAGLKLGIVKTRLTFSHLSGYRNTGVTPAQRVKAYDTADFYVGVDVLDRATLALEVRNLFDRDPPFVDAATGWDPQSANPLPRMFVINARTKF